jgi:hypothetical protein
MLKIDPEKYFNFDFSTGKIAYSENPGHAIIVPVEALREFARVQTSEEPHKSFYNLGVCVGRYFGDTLSRLHDRRSMEDDVSPEDFINNLNGLMSLHGLGLVAMETWGDVLIFEWEILVETSLMTSDFQEGVLAGILKEFSRKEFEVATVENGSRKKGKFLAGNAQMIKSARQWVEEGAGTGEIVARLKKGLHLR